MDSKDVSRTRRSLLQAGLAAGASALMPTHTLLGQSKSAAVVTGRTFRGWVSRGSGTGRTTLQDLTLRPISGRQVVVRTEATKVVPVGVSVVEHFFADLNRRAPARR